jgi:hypothetical protein
MAREVPARRHDPNMQNFIYKRTTDPAVRRREEEQVARIAQKLREQSAQGNNGAR